jgi:hypothetical protein
MDDRNAEFDNRNANVGIDAYSDVIRVEFGSNTEIKASECGSRNFIRVREIEPEECGSTMPRRRRNLFKDQHG